MYKLLLSFFIAAYPAMASDYYSLSKIDKPKESSPKIYGGYAGGCIYGADKLPQNGDGYQAMRLKRNRYWGHPDLTDYLKKLGQKIQKDHPWKGMLVGDMSQPVGGPMKSGHKSHQSGLDVDLWLDPAPTKILSYKERHTKSASSHVRPDMSIRESWTQAHRDFVLLSADDKRVTRIFIHAALKKDICENTEPNHPALRKIRPWYGHDDHIHVRLECPKGSPDCVHQAPPPAGDGCKGHDLEWWFSEEARNPKPKKAKKQKVKKKDLSDLPEMCQKLAH